MVHAGPSPARSTVQRAKAMVLTPNEEWGRIASERPAPPRVLVRYVLPLAAIAPVCGLIGGQVFGYGAFGFTYRPGMGHALGTAVISFALGVAMVFVLAGFARWLAPRFGGRADGDSAFLLVAYGSTAMWLAGLFGLVPWLAVFTLLALHSIYQVRCGTSPMLGVPRERASGFTAAFSAVALVLAFLIAPATSGLLELAGAAEPPAESGRVVLPGGRKIDPGRPGQPVPEDTDIPADPAG